MINSNIVVYCNTIIFNFKQNFSYNMIIWRIYIFSENFFFGFCAFALSTRKRYNFFNCIWRRSILSLLLFEEMTEIRILFNLFKKLLEELWIFEWILSTLLTAFGKRVSLFLFFCLCFHPFMNSSIFDLLFLNVLGLLHLYWLLFLNRELWLDIQLNVRFFTLYLNLSHPLFLYSP